MDTTCSHMGCELKWNDAEKTTGLSAVTAHDLLTQRGHRRIAFKALQRLNFQA